MVPEHVLLLHGQPGSGSDWAGIVAALPDSWPISAPDRLGYGANPEDPGDFRANAEQLLSALDDAGVRRTVVVGHSFGGGVALELAKVAPDRVAALVLIAAVGPGCISGWDRLLAAPLAGPVCAVAAWWLTPWVARARLARIARLRGAPIEPHEYVNWHVWGHARRERGPLWRTFLVEQRALLRDLEELGSQLDTVRVPALVLTDPCDTLVPLKTAQELAGRLPHARLQLLESAGHHPPRRAPEAVAAAMTTFVEALPVTGDRAAG